MLILKNCHLVYTGEERLFGKDVFIEGNRILKIADTSGYKTSSEDEIIDCSNHVVIPGLINTHHHFYQVLTRNLPAVQNAELFDWLVYLYEVWKNITPEAVYYSSLAAIGELMKTGCTSASDHHYLYPENFSDDIMDIQFEAAEKLGIRFSPCRGSMSRSKKDGGLPPDSVVQTEEAILAHSEHCLSKHHDTSDFSMKRVILAPCSPFSVTKEIMKESVLLARKYNAKLHTHLAETMDENESCKVLYGMRPLELMEDCGFIGSDVYYAHGIHFNDDELKLLKKTDTGVSHCPSSNMRLGSGIARIKDMRELGIKVSLAVDGSASNDSSDMLGEVRNALLLQRVKYGASALSTEEAFDIASSGGAKTLGFDKCGKLKQGMAADMAIFNINNLAYAGSNSDPLASLIFCGYNHQTDYTIVNGKVTVKNGKLCNFNEDEITEKVNKISSELISKI